MVRAQPESYDPDRSHVFVCYAHADRNSVFAELEILRSADINLWYDEGIDPGREWPEELAAAIASCSTVLFFVSPAAVRSRNCRNELQYARDRDKPIVAVYLEQTSLPPALQLTLATTHALQRYALDPLLYRHQLIAALHQGAVAPVTKRRIGITPRQRERALWTTALAAILTATLILLFRPTTEPTTLAGTRFSLQVPATLDITPEAYFEMFVPPPVAISPDARHVVFAARNADNVSYLYRRPLDRFDTQRISGTEGAIAPFFSPDGRSVGFLAGRTLKKVALTGGNPETIVTGLENAGFGGASWGENGQIVYSPSAVAGLYRVPAAGGASVRLTEPVGLQGELSHVMPQILPGGDKVLYSVRMGLAPESPVVQVVDLATGARRTVAEEAIGARYAQGRLIYGGTAAASESLWSVPFDLATLTTTGAAERVLESLSADLYALPYYDLAPSGALVFIPPGELPLDELIWIEPGKDPVVLVEHHENMLMPKISPDNKLVAITIVNDARGMGLWLVDSLRGKMVRFNEGLNSHSAIWTPDGRALAFTADHDGPSNLYLKQMDTGAPLVRLTTSEQHHDAASFSPDGAYLTYSELHPETNWDIWFVDMDTRISKPFLRTNAEEIQGLVTPRGGWIAYTSNETGQREIYLARFPSGAGKRRISVNGGLDTVWSRDGNVLYYRWQSAVYRVHIQFEPEVSVGDVQRVWEGSFEGRAGYGTANWDVAADERFLLTSRQSAALAQQVNVVLEWLHTL